MMRRGAGPAARNRLSACTKSPSGAIGARDQQRNHGLGGCDRRRGDAGRDTVRRWRHGVADLGQRPAVGPVSRRLRLVDALDPQRAAAIALVYRRRPRPAGSRRVVYPTRAAHRRGAGADHRRGARCRVAGARAAAHFRVFVRRCAGRACRGSARRPGAGLYRRRLKRARPDSSADRSAAGERQVRLPQRRSPPTGTISAR